MGALRPFAIVNDYDGLQQACREYVETLNVSRAVIDEVSGLQSGYVAKILSPNKTNDDKRRRFGMVSLGSFMQSVGLVLIVAQDVDALAQMRHRLPARDKRQVRHRPRLITDESAAP